MIQKEKYTSYASTIKKTVGDNKLNTFRQKVTNIQSTQSNKLSYNNMITSINQNSVGINISKIKTGKNSRKQINLL